MDLAGDQPAVLGHPEPVVPGLADWLAGGRDVPPDALGRLEVQVTPALRLLPAGKPRPSDAAQVELLASLLADERRPVVIDAGLVHATDAGSRLAATSTHSLLVARPCYLGLRKAVACPVRPSGVVVVSEGWRALDAADVADVVDAPVVAEITASSAVARAVDAGLLASRLPRSLERSVQQVVRHVA